MLRISGIVCKTRCFLSSTNTEWMAQYNHGQETDCPHCTYTYFKVRLIIPKFFSFLFVFLDCIRENSQNLFCESSPLHSVSKQSLYCLDRDWSCCIKKCILQCEMGCYEPGRILDIVTRRRKFFNVLSLMASKSVRVCIQQNLTSVFTHLYLRNNT
jgi:hypothetical protein